ncbi:WD repeat-containing protein 70-like [Lingula anatina]|uniref:WD repeat-containing protein 70 n=1 Tax=Lingula anatina TaxID=7574 RepID=A0A1S3HHI7_LINAN|nr:WD repeat-containing protein 70-like [Lingula anatina]|eukprot:XP_013385487.1 WD repeat-containing protein 70-like [Lingula anatina]
MDQSRTTGDKKARTFDFMSMFEETRKNAVERSKKTLEERENSQGQSSPTAKKAHGESTPSEKDIKSVSDLIGPPVPSSTSKNDEEDLIGPPLPPSFLTSNRDDTTKKKNKESNDDEEEEEDSEEEEEEALEKRIPASHEITLEHGSKTVSALGLDPSGARLVTGGFDYDVKFWDFSGMDSSLQSFRMIRPCESHQIKALEYSTTGDMILVVSGSAQAKLIDRDGFEVMECPKGDQYLVDMASTRGHTAMLNCGCWNPKIKEEFMTCSYDGSVRLWDINNDKKHKNIIKPRSQVGRKVVPTCCAYSPDGKLIAAACQDGSIQMWDYKKYIVNVALMNRTAHQNGTDTSCIRFSYDGRVLATRGGDDTLKLWDIRNFKKPLVVANDLFNLFPMTDCIFSPDDKMVVTGISLNKNETTGKLIFFERETLQRVTEMEISNSNVVRCLWHPKLNQIVVGSGDGKVKMLYDPDRSQRGAKLCVVKTKRKVQQVEAMTAQRIITPYALPMFKEERQKSTKKITEKSRQDPVKSRRPDLPITGPGSGGRLAAHGSTLSQYVAQQIVIRKHDERDKDPRAAILRHAEDAEKNPYWVTPAYSQSQPQNILHHAVEDEEEPEEEGPMWKKPKTK